MSRLSHKERQRLRRRDRRREQARERHQRKADGFLSWWGGSLPLPRFDDGDADALFGIDDLETLQAFLVEHPERPELWEMYLSILHAEGAPSELILEELARWVEATDQLSAHELYVDELIANGLADDARRHAEKTRKRFYARGSLVGLREVEALAERARKAAVHASRAQGGSAPRPRTKERVIPLRLVEPCRSPRKTAATAEKTATEGTEERSAPSEPSPRVASPALPAAEPEAVPVRLHVSSLDRLLVRLSSAPDRDVSFLERAEKGAEILAEDHYDRLLCLDTITGIEHLDYQLETVFRVLKRFRGRVLLADEVGLGKTIEAGLVLKEYLLRGQVRRALVLCPPALVGQWQGELEEKFGISVVTTQSADFRRDPEAFWSGEGVRIASLALARGTTHMKRVLAERFDLVIVDEGHHLKNRATRGWQLVNGLRSRFFLILTATPVETNLVELYNLVTLLRPGTLGSEGEFRRRFVRTGDPTAPKDADRLRDLLREVMIRNTRAVCGVKLPPRVVRTEIVRPLPEEEVLYSHLVAAARRATGRFRATVRVLLEEAGSSPMAVARTAGLALGRCDDDQERRFLAAVEDTASAIRDTRKLDRLVEHLAGGKVLVFSRFHATLEWIEERLRARGVPIALFHGQLSGPERDRAVELFRSPGTDVLLCSEVGGEGQNLQFAHRLINFDLPWNPMKIEQRIGRLHRIGQSETVEVMNLATAGTADERILDVLDRRVNLFELVIGEMDLILGEFSEDRSFAHTIHDIYARSASTRDLDLGFDRLTEQLIAARGKLERIKALDEKLFGEDYDV